MAAVFHFPVQRPDHRAALRHRIEHALAMALDAADFLVAYLDDLDGDPDAEDDGTAEPALAALVGLETQTRWAGFEGGAA